MEKVMVCASMNIPKNKNIIKQARELGYMLADSGVEYVQGGSAQGLMGETLKAFLTKSKNVKFIIPNAYYDYDAPELEKLVGKENFHVKRVEGEADRLKLLRKCDRIIVLPGGLGTLEELLYCNETARAKEHCNKIDLINIDGYYDGFLKQVKTNIKEGLSKPNVIKFNVINDVNELDFNNVKEV